MKISKTLSRRDSTYSFFRIYDTDYTICTEFTELLSGQKLNSQLIARIEIATKNPKKKGFRKVILKEILATIGGKEFSLIPRQRKVLRSLNIGFNDAIWMKAELA